MLLLSRLCMLQPKETHVERHERERTSCPLMRIFGSGQTVEGSVPSCVMHASGTYRTKLMLQNVDGANVSVEKEGFAGGLHGGFNDGYAVDHSRRNIKYGVRRGEVTSHSVEITAVGMVVGVWPWTSPPTCLLQVFTSHKGG